jgi:hypothetical protein
VFFGFVTCFVAIVDHPTKKPLKARSPEAASVLFKLDRVRRFDDLANAGTHDGTLAVLKAASGRKSQYKILVRIRDDHKWPERQTFSRSGTVVSLRERFVAMLTGGREILCEAAIFPKVRRSRCLAVIRSLLRQGSTRPGHKGC